MQLQYIFASRSLMETVYVLCDHGAKLTLPLELCEPKMRAVWLYTLNDKLCTMKTVILVRILAEKAVAQDRFRRVLPLLVVQSVNAAKIGYPAFRTDACTAEENNVAALFPTVSVC